MKSVLEKTKASGGIVIIDNKGFSPASLKENQMPCGGGR